VTLYGPRARSSRGSRPCSELVAIRPCRPARSCCRRPGREPGRSLVRNTAISSLYEASSGRRRAWSRPLSLSLTRRTCTVSRRSRLGRIRRSSSPKSCTDQKHEPPDRTHQVVSGKKPMPALRDPNAGLKIRPRSGLRFRPVQRGTYAPHTGAGRPIGTTSRPHSPHGSTQQQCASISWQQSRQS
jgi:hypothetical protein